jgi:hypothetical protein
METTTGLVTLRDHFNSIYEPFYSNVCNKKGIPVIFSSFDGHNLFEYFSRSAGAKQNQQAPKECFLVNQNILFLGHQASANKARWVELRLDLLALALVRRGYAMRSNFSEYDLINTSFLIPEIYKHPTLFSPIANYVKISRMENDDQDTLNSIYLRDSLLVSAWALLPVFQNKIHSSEDERIIFERLKVHPSRMRGN